MARPKAGTDAGDAATLRWRKTMIKKYGGKKNFKRVFQEMGRKGGSVSGIQKGFALDSDRARKAGAIGGRKSRRGGCKETREAIEKLDSNRKKIEKELQRGYSLPQIAKDMDVRYRIILRWAHQNLDAYQREEDERAF